MFTVNLEEVLKRQHKKVITPKELLAIEQYDKLSDQTIITILERTGFTGTYKPGQDLKSRLQATAVSNAQFPQDRVYHISQIKKLCNKYRLKFLPTKIYRGQVPPNIADILVQQERDFNFKLQPETSFIMAPASSFELKKKPKDPLLFHKINEDHYFLLHKWGNDLSMLRALQRYFHPSVIMFATGILGAIFSRYASVPTGTSINERSLCMFALGCIMAVLFGLFFDTAFVYDKDEQ